MPADAAALKALRALPGLDVVVSRTLGRLNEANMKMRMTRGREPADEHSHPRLLRLYSEVLEVFDVTDRWPLYVVPMGGINAGAVGMKAPFIVLNSGPVLQMSDDQLRYAFG